MSRTSTYRGFVIKHAMFRGAMFLFAVKNGKEIARASYKSELKRKLDRILDGEPAEASQL